MKKLLSFILLCCASVYAVDGANTLLEKAAKLEDDKSTLEEVKVISKESLNYYTGFKIDNPFSAHMFSVLIDSNNTNHTYKVWLAKILKNDFEQALKSLAGVEKSLSPEQRTTYDVARSYMFWRLSYNNLFLNSWYNTANRKAKDTKAWKLFDEYLKPHAGKFIAKNPLSFTPEQKEYLLSKDNTTAFGTELRNFLFLRSGKKSLETLSTLPKGHPLEVPMGYSAAFYLAKNERIGDAGKILKSRIEPAIESLGSTEELSKYYLLIGRLLFQARAFSAAKSFYEKIPTGDKNYLQAQAELTWISLHIDDTAVLRGKLKTLTSSLFADEFIPESYVVRAISNLKLCQFDRVWTDFSEFIAKNKVWAKKFRKDPKAGNYDLARGKNFYISRLESAIAAIKAEQVKISALKSSYWAPSLAQLLSQQQFLQEYLTSEYERFYKTLRAKLNRAILKMRFVKIETLDQIQRFQKPQSAMLEDSVSITQAAVSDGKVAFPYDGVYWPDEVFRLRSMAKSNCEKRQGVAK